MKTSAVIATIAMASAVAAQAPAAAAGIDLTTLLLLQGGLFDRDSRSSRSSRSSRGGLFGGDIVSTLALTGGLGGVGGAAGALDLTTLVALDSFGNAQYYGRNAFGELLPLAALTGGNIAGLNTQQLVSMYALDEVAGDNDVLPLMALTGGLAGVPTNPVTQMWALNGLQSPRGYYAPRSMPRSFGYGPRFAPRVMQAPVAVEEPKL